MKQKVSVVLVRPTYSGNIGACVRVLANMGGDRLILIAPECEIDDSAKKNACGARDWIQNIQIYKSWEEFNSHEKTGARIALSRRIGKRRIAKDLRENLKEFMEQAPLELKESSIFLVLGPEADGLSQADAEQCHRLAYLPIQGEFQSMNLSHAALLAMFIAQETLLESPRQNTPKTESDLFSEKKYFPENTIREWLEAIGFDVDARKKSAFIVLRRILLQNWPSPYELHVLESILQQNIRKLRDPSLLFKKIADQLSEISAE